MKNVMQDHPKATTAAVIAIGVFVVLVLYFLSLESPSTPSTSDGVIAHGTRGPAVIGGGGAGEAGSGEEIRDVDFSLVLSEDISGGLSLETVLYVDVDANGADEAVVLLRGKGDSRPLTWRLYSIRNDQAQLLFERGNVAQGELRADGPRLVESEGVFGEADPPCCPSSVKKTFYSWKGDGLVVTKVEAAPPQV